MYFLPLAHIVFSHIVFHALCSVSFLVSPQFMQNLPQSVKYNIEAPDTEILENSMDFQDEPNGTRPGTCKRLKIITKIGLDVIINFVIYFIF